MAQTTIFGGDDGRLVAPREFIETLVRHSPADGKRVLTAIDRFLWNPQHPSLRLHKLPCNGWWSVSASDDLRILLARDDLRNAWIVSYAGHHDDAYR